MGDQYPAQNFQILAPNEDFQKINGSNLQGGT